MIETKEFRITPKKMFSVLYMNDGIIWTCVAISGILAFALIGAFSDPRFFIVALIWVFIVFPMMVAFLYFVYGMQPLTTFNTIPHSILFSEDKVELNFAEENDAEGKAINSHKSYSIDKDKYEKMKSGPDYVILFFNKSGWIWLPVNSFESVADFQSVVKSFLKK